MKVKMQKWGKLLVLTVLCMLAVNMHGGTAQAAGVTAAVNTNRSAGTCSYTVGGLDLTTDTALTIRVERSDNKAVALTKEFTLSEENVINGTYTGVISLEDLKYDYTSYAVYAVVGDTTVKAGVCDFSVHQSKISLAINGNSGSAVRTAVMTSTEGKGGVLAPGSGNQISVYAWQRGKSEAGAKLIGTAKNLTGNGLTWNVDVTKAGRVYGKWNAKLVLTNSHWTSGRNIAAASYEIAPTCVSFAQKKTSALEKKKSFQMVLSGLKNVVPVKTVSFLFYNTKNKQVYKTTAKKSGDKYVANIKLSKLKYQLQIYTVKAVITDTDGVSQVMAVTADADEQVIPGAFDIKIKNNATSRMKLTGAYIPGNIKKVVYVVRSRTSKKKLGTYKAKLKKKSYIATVPSERTGKYTVTVFGYTKWNKKVTLTQKNYKIGKKNMGKQGWRYEKYQGKKYKFYYIDNEKQTDLTKILKLKKGRGKYMIEINRAACVLTVYMYNNDTKKYDIPVKACTICVGSDARTVAGAGSLNTSTYFTPIGNYSICSNGTAVRYPLKPMYEPDGRTIYARWCTHIVGNVYFHAIAVDVQSHTALSPSKFNRLGTPASAGCIRMTVADAKWLYDYMPTGTSVKIKVGSSSKPGPLGKPKTIKVSGINYDPTDPAIPDSRKKKDYKAGKITGYMNKKGKKIGYE